MMDALRAKFSQNTQLRDQLKATEGAWLIEHTRNDKQWGDGSTNLFLINDSSCE